MKKNVIIFIIFSIFLFNSCTNKKNKASQIGEKKISAPELKLEGIYNKSDNLSPTLESLKGKIVILDFWAIWCSPCVAAFPENNRLYEKYKNQGIRFIAITDDPKEKLENFLKKVDVKFWIGRDDDKQEFINYQISGRPQMYIINREGNIVYKGSSITEDLIEEVIATNNIAVKKESEMPNVITNGGFSGGEDPLYNAVDIMLNRNEKGKDYRPKPKLINHFIIRPSLNGEFGGNGWSQNGEYCGVTYYGGKLENVFQFLNDLSSPIWIKNHTKDTTLYDIVYWRKNKTLDDAFEEIQEGLIEGLSIKFKKTQSIQNVNKLLLSQKNEYVLSKDDIIDGTIKAYTPISTFITQLENKSKEYFVIDKSLQDVFIYNKGMEWKKLNSSTLEEIILFLKDKDINIIKVKEKIDIYEIFTNESSR